MKRRKVLEERLVLILMRLVTLSIILVFVFILAVIFNKGFHAISWEMISQGPKGGFYFGKGGGILNAIVGSLYLALGSTFLALLLGLPVALGMNVHWVSKTRLVGAIRFLLDALWGVPSIVFGAFGFALMAYLELRASLLAGVITVTLFIVPIFVRAFDEVLRTVPQGLLEAAYSLGANRTQIAFSIFFRQALPGFITAILLAFGRGIGDAASVLFTAGYTDHIPQSIQDPTATLPLAIFFQLSSPIAEVKERAFGAALVLMAIILLISIASRLATKRFKKHIL